MAAAAAVDVLIPTCNRPAALADALHGHGYRLAINGTKDERAIVARVRHHMRAPALDLSGVLSVSGLAGLLARARLLVSNDTGPLHLAQAVGTATGASTGSPTCSCRRPWPRRGIATWWPCAAAARPAAPKT